MRFLDKHFPNRTWQKPKMRRHPNPPKGWTVERYLRGDFDKKPKQTKKKR